MFRLALVVVLDYQLTSVDLVAVADDVVERGRHLHFAYDSLVVAVVSLAVAAVGAYFEPVLFGVVADIAAAGLFAKAVDGVRLYYAC